MLALPRRRYLAVIGSTALAGCGATDTACPVTTPSDPGTDWPRPRRDAGNSAAAPAEAMPDPTGMTEQWRFETGRRTWPPVVADGRVFVTLGRPIADDPAMFDPEVVALDATDGSELWRHTVPNETGSTVPSVSRAVVADGTVYASVSAWSDGDRRATVRAIAADTGRKEWSVTRPVAGIETVLGGLLVVHRAEGFEAIDAADGSQCWRFGEPGLLGSAEEWGLYGLPALVGETLAAILSDGGRQYRLAGIDATTGETQWESEPFEATFPPFHPVAADGTVLVPAGRAVRGYAPSDGAVRWTTSALQAGEPLRDLAVGAERFVTGRDGLYGLSLADRALRWRRSDGGNGVVIAGDYVLATRSRRAGGESYVHDLLVLAGATGDVVARTTFENGLSWSPVVAGGRVFCHTGTVNQSGDPDGSRLYAYG